MSALLANRWLGYLAAAVALVFVGSVLAVWMTGAPEPVKPSMEALSPVNISLSGTSMETGDDFVRRPLFLAGRRPTDAPAGAQEAAAPVAQQSPTQAPNARALDKVVVRGTFASGDAAGAIVAAEGKRYRVLVGESFRGWELTGVEDAEVEFAGEVFVGQPPQSRRLRLEHALVEGGGENGAAAGNPAPAAPPK